MLEIINPETDPFYNLALEEYCLQNFNDREVMILWQNIPTVVIGKNQNAIEEINLEYAKEKDIKVVRRLSGGGAVYHDLGNLNFTFIVQENSRINSYDFPRFTRPVIDSLGKIGVIAEDNGRNDITIKEKKFSGNAQYRSKNKLLHHGTLLFNTDLEEMERVLHVSPEKMNSKSVKSVRSRVTNIAGHLNKPVDIKMFKDILTQTVFYGKKHDQYMLNENEKKAVKRLKEEKYLSWEFIYGSSPPFNMTKKARFDWGYIKVYLNIRKGIITDCTFYGDFFTHGEITELASHLSGVRYREESIRERLEGLDIVSYLPHAGREELVKLLIS